MASSPVEVDDDGSKGHDKTMYFTTKDKIWAASFYAVCSIAVIFTNKMILTNYAFPYFNFLATVQFCVTIFVISLLVLLGRIQVSYLTMDICKQIIPISLMFLANIICGLGSTKSLNLPMFTALRRFSILFTMIAEWCYLGTRPSTQILWSVVFMVGGAVIAAMYDLSFDWLGYSFIFFNNVFTAMNGVCMKKATISGKCSKNGILFYNSLFSGIFMLIYFLAEDAYIHRLATTNDAIIPVYSTRQLHQLGGNSVDWHSFDYSFQLISDILLSHEGRRRGLESAIDHVNNLRGLGNPVVRTVRDETTRNSNTNAIPNPKLNPPPPSNAHHMSKRVLESTISGVLKFEGWNDPEFQLMFFVSSVMGCILNYSIFLCTTINSALTTAVIGALKNIAVTYVGMLVFSDYNFSWVNFVGINISILGSLYYTHITMFKGVAGYGG
jgi:hypothetical protein